MATLREQIASARREAFSAGAGMTFTVFGNETIHGFVDSTPNPQGQYDMEPQSGATTTVRMIWADASSLSGGPLKEGVTLTDDKGFTYRIITIRPTPGNQMLVADCETLLP